ncbi:MAG: cytochrome c oxidase accessory protein CcoG [Pseudomonadota bacterium]|nr:MAG: cytochrome c oxidase accessory protein CcoG [Pseudomonadota bacterium]
MSADAYQARIPIYPRSVKGRFRTLKTAILVLAYGVYFLLPWLRWERAGTTGQAVLFDLQARHFYLFDLVVYAQDIFWLAGFLVIAAFLLFFVTGIAGRVFCGYFCFQTLWADVFVFIERLVQGERNARIRLAAAPWTGQKLLKIGATHLLWLGVAFGTGLTFALYWADAPELAVQVLTGAAPFPAYATTLFLTATTYVMAGLAREQVCTYMCPYARFQGVMFDEDTLVVAYDAARGEGTAGRRKPTKGMTEREARQAQGVGDCIDCGYCVQVCPVGIDIRNGLQYQCISCALCIDACDTVMDTTGFPRGLVAYSSERHLIGKKNRYLRPRNIGYALALLAVMAALVWSIATRNQVEMVARQVRQPLSVTLSDGREQNRYEVKINNKTNRTVRYRLSIAGLPGAELDTGGLSVIEAPPQGNVQLVARVKLEPRDATASRQLFEFVVTPLDTPVDEPLAWESVFYMPPARLARSAR